MGGRLQSRSLSGFGAIYLLKNVETKSATQAAIQAGYSKKTAEQTASRLLSFVKVKEAIAEAMENREKRTEITQDKVLRELAKIGFANMADYMRNGAVVHCG